MSPDSSGESVYTGNCIEGSNPSVSAFLNNSKFIVMNEQERLLS